MGRVRGVWQRIARALHKSVFTVPALKNYAVGMKRHICELDEEKQKSHGGKTNRVRGRHGPRYIFAATDSEKYTGAVGGCHSQCAASVPCPKVSLWW